MSEYLQSQPKHYLSYPDDTPRQRRDAVEIPSIPTEVLPFLPLSFFNCLSKALAAYTIWSTYMMGPVFVKPTRKDTEGRNVVKAEVEPFSRRGNSFTIQPIGSSAGRQTIPHYLMTIPTDLKALKKWTDGQDFYEVYKNGGRSLERRIPCQEGQQQMLTSRPSS